MDLGTFLGFTGLSGVDAYVPVLWLLLDAAFHPNQQYINPHVAFLSNGWWMALFALMALADFLLDKIPGVVDIGWNAIHTLIRPAMGGLIIAATSRASGGSYTGAILLGGFVAFIAHALKMGTRFGSTATTGGCASPFLSLGEDIFVIIILRAIFGAYS